MTILEIQERDKLVKDLFDEAVAIDKQARSLEHLGYDIDWRELDALEKHALLMRKHHNRSQRRFIGWWHRDQAGLHINFVQQYITKFYQQRGAQMAA